MKILSSLAHPALVSFFCLNAEVDILENIGNQAVDGSHWLPQYGKNTMEVSGYSQLEGE